MEDRYLKKEELEEYCAYACNGRNIAIGIWFKGRMYGLRYKFGETFVDSENHYDDGAENFGTLKPLFKLTSSLSGRLHPCLFDVTNWRGQCVLHDILYSLSSILPNNLDKFKEFLDEN